MSENPTPFEEPAVRRDAPDEVRPTDFDRDRDRDRDRVRDRDWQYRRHRGDRNRGTWIGGAILILLGIVFLLNNAGIRAPFLENWWAFFILIPAVSSFNRAWNDYKAQGRLGGSGVGALVSGFVLTLVAITFLLGLSWSLMLPLLLILGGLSILITAIAVSR